MDLARVEINLHNLEEDFKNLKMSMDSSIDDKAKEIMSAVKDLAMLVAEVKVMIEEHKYTADAHNPGMMRKPKNE